MFQNTSVIDKTYKKLAIQVSLNGLSFATFDTLLNKPLTLQKIEIGNVSITSKIDEFLTLQLQIILILIFEIDIAIVFVSLPYSHKTD